MTASEWLEHIKTIPDDRISGDEFVNRWARAFGPCDDILPLTDDEIEAYKQDKLNEKQDPNNPISDIRE